MPWGQKLSAGFLVLLALAGLAGCSPSTPQRESLAFKAVLIAGDDSIPAFSNAVRAMHTELERHSLVAPADITEFHAAGIGTDQATPRNILTRIAALHPAPGQGCLIYATSHGGKRKGIWLQASHSFLAPADLDFALDLGCRQAPTVVIVSACFSGQFARTPMLAPNRIILTASRADRDSFGCSAGRDFTVYDRCLLHHMDSAGNWRLVFEATRACVIAEERKQHLRPSEPQFYAGSAAQPGV